MTKDLFSRQSEVYARFRPSYPQDLYDYILQFVGEKNMAWDCATGNGQAALALAPFFSRVEATDISPEQIVGWTGEQLVLIFIGAGQEQNDREQQVKKTLDHPQS